MECPLTDKHTIPAPASVFNDLCMNVSIFIKVFSPGSPTADDKPSGSSKAASTHWADTEHLEAGPLKLGPWTAGYLPPFAKSSAAPPPASCRLFLRDLLPLKMSIASMFTKAAGKRSRDDWEEVEDVEELKSVIEAKEVTTCML